MTSSIKKTISFLAVIVLLTGCATVSAPLRTQADPSAIFAKGTSIAFLPEGDLRIEKRMFYERIATYLKGAGLNVTNPESAEFLLRVQIETELETRVTIAPNVVTPHIAGANTTVRRIQGDTTFRFIAYRRADVEKGRMASVWEASIAAPDRLFRDNEEQFVVGIFQHFGATFDGVVHVKKHE